MKSEKGISGVDVIVAVFLITMFVVLITVMSSRLSQSENEISRSSEALMYANNLVEEIKQEDIEKFVGFTNTDLDNLEAIDVSMDHELYMYSEQYIVDKNMEETSYYQKIYIIDYADINIDAEREIIKKIVVTVLYKDQGQVKTITLETMINGGV